MAKKDTYKNIPSVNEILSNLDEQSKKHSTEFIKIIIDNILSELREKISSSTKYDKYEKEDFLNLIKKNLNKRLIHYTDSLFKVINCTGIIIHTNIGRCPISESSLDCSRNLSRGYMNLEYDVEKNQRRDRNLPLRELFSLMTGYEDMIVVNNNAASLLLIFNTFAKGRAAMVSRGELIEIGDGFRLLDIIKSSGAEIQEIGSTNRTYINDYEDNITQDTKIILKVNKSNYKMDGFTSEVETKDLSILAKQQEIILVEDIGCGSIINLEKYGLHNVKDVVSAKKDGADLICFSTDKMFGSVQGAIIAGKREYIQKIRKNPIFRALRAGKNIISMLYDTLKLYTYDDFEQKIPIYRILTQDKREIYFKAIELCQKITNEKFENVTVEDSNARLGGGVSFEDIKSYCVVLKHKRFSPSRIESKLRESKYHIVPYIKNDNLILDMMCVYDDEIDKIAEIINSIK